MTEQRFTDWLDSLGWIRRGDCIYIVSDMLELVKLYRRQGARFSSAELIEYLQQAVGEEGTLLFPTFNWDFCKGVGYDYYKTPVRTGALSKAALGRADFDRTAHPLYSFAVWGAGRKELLENASVDSFGPGTVFEKLYDWNARILVIGLPALSGVSYIHHVEQTVGVPYRYSKDFTGDYTDENGTCTRRTYRMYVRDLDMDPKHINGFEPLAEQMKADGLIQTAAYSGLVPCHMLLISDLDAAVRNDILYNDSGKMYVYHHAVVKDVKLY